MEILLTLVVIFIFGAAVGSFLNVVAYRSIHGGSIIFDRSKCPHCKHKLVTADLVPILSFIILRGKCRYCSKKISWQYPLVELSTGLLFVIVSLQGLALEPEGQALNFAYTLFVLSVLIIIFITDIKSGLIPDKVIFPALAIAFIFKLLLLITPFLSNIQHPTSTIQYPISTIQIISDATAGVLAAAFFYLLVTVTKGKGMGGGDVKYALFLGFALGASKLAVALFLAFLTGAFLSLILISVGKKRFGQTIPFGPFLSVGGFAALLFGNEILNWYLGLH